MINEQLKEVITQQVTEEYGAAYTYRYLANEMDALSFPGMCAWFTAQAQEELEHAQKFAQHLIDRGEHVQPRTIEINAPEIHGPLDAFRAALEHERKVSEQIRNITRTADEVGDLLFVLANLARKLHLDPEECLRRANGKFTRRFEAVEQRLATEGKAPADATLDEMEAHWTAAKRAERPTPDGA